MLNRVLESDSNLGGMVREGLSKQVDRVVLEASAKATQAMGDVAA